MDSVDAEIDALLAEPLDGQPAEFAIRYPAALDQDFLQRVEARINAETLSTRVDRLKHALRFLTRFKELEAGFLGINSLDGLYKLYEVYPELYHRSTGAVLAERSAEKGRVVETGQRAGFADSSEPWQLCLEMQRRRT